MHNQKLEMHASCYTHEKTRCHRLYIQYYLNIEVSHAQSASCCLPNHCKRLHLDVVQSLTYVAKLHPRKGKNGQYHHKPINSYIIITDYFTSIQSDQNTTLPTNKHRVAFSVLYFCIFLSGPKRLNHEFQC